MSLIFIGHVTISEWAMARDIMPSSVVRINWEEAINYGIDVSIKEHKKYITIAIDVDSSEVCDYEHVISDSIRKRLFGGNEYIKIPVEINSGVLQIRVERRLFENLQVVFKCIPGSDVDFYYLNF